MTVEERAATPTTFLTLDGVLTGAAVVRRKEDAAIKRESQKWRHLYATVSTADVAAVSITFPSPPTHRLSSHMPAALSASVMFLQASSTVEAMAL